MTHNLSPQKKKSGANGGIKLLIASASLAISFGLWNLFSYRQLAEVKASLQSSTQPPPSPGDMLNPPPLPTLVPLLSGVEAGGSEAQNVPASSEGLRVVVVPAPTEAAKRKPVIQEVFIDVPGGAAEDSGGGSSSGPSTHSS